MIKDLHIKSKASDVASHQEITVDVAPHLESLVEKSDSPEDAVTEQFLIDRGMDHH